jgi:hypothetical protein
VQLLGPDDFGQQPARIVRSAALADTNQLTITLISPPGSFLTVDVECAPSKVTLSSGNPGESTRNGVLAIALPIINSGTAAAENVQVTRIALSGGALTSPSVPFRLGTIAANGGSAVLNASFSGTLSSRASETLSVDGRYSEGAATYCFTVRSAFTVPPSPSSPSPGLGVTTVAPNSVTGGRFPHQPLNFPDTVNTPRWTVPTIGQTTFQTNPSGLPVSVDGGAPMVTPFVLTLSSGSHTITVAPTQAGSKGTRYVFTGWNDGGAASHQIALGSVPTTYTASFATLYLLTTSALPAGAGSILVTPASEAADGYYESGTKVTVTARPNPTYLFAGFRSPLAGTTNPQVIVMTAPASVVADFTPR